MSAGPQTICRGNLAMTMVLAVNITPASTAANSTVEQQFVIQGLVSSDQISGFEYQGGPFTNSSVSAVNFRCTGNNIVAIAFQNVSSAAVSGQAGLYYMEVNRLDNPAFTVSSIA